MITENLSTLKIHKLTQEQYNRELQAGRIDPNALYLTPDTDTSNIYIQNEEPVNVEDGVLWVDMDANSTGGSGGIGGASVFVQDEEPTGADTGTLWLDTDEKSNSGGTSGGGGSYEIPTFNLTEMGLPIVPMDGTIVRAETDTAAIRVALDAGLIKLTVHMYFNGYSIPVTSIDRGHYVAVEDCYQICTMTHTYNASAGGHMIHAATLNIYPTQISASIVSIQTVLPDVEEATF